MAMFTNAVRAAVVAVSLALIAAGVLLALYANSIRTELHVASTTCVTAGSGLGDTPASHKDKPAVTRLSLAQAQACSVSRLSPGLRLAQLTVKRETVSDTLLATLLATSLALVVCGAFFPRVESITVAGISLGVGRRDRKDTGKAVDQIAQTMPQEVPPETVQRAKLAAQEKAADLRDVAAGRREIPPIPVSSDRLAELRRGNPLPADLLDELANRALKEQLEREGGDPGHE